MKKTDNSIYIVKDGVRYRLRRGIGCDCVENCSFRNQMCEDELMFVCNLPKWFSDLGITDAWLERVDPKVELLKAVNGRVRKIERAHKATQGSKMIFK